MFKSQKRESSSMRLRAFVCGLKKIKIEVFFLYMIYLLRALFSVYRI